MRFQMSQYELKTIEAVINWFEKYRNNQGTDQYNIAEAYLTSEVENSCDMTFALDEEEYRA